MYRRNYFINLVAALIWTIGLLGCDKSDDSDNDSDASTDTDMDTDTDSDTDTDTDTDSDTNTSTSGGNCDDTIDADAGEFGEWADPDSGLIWQNPPYGKGACWETAVEYCEAFGDGWRLPNINELRSLIRGCPANETGGECGLSDPDCLGVNCTEGCELCETLQGPGNTGCYYDPQLEGSCEPSGGYCGGMYWSSSEAAQPGDIWVVDFMAGGPDGIWPFQFNCAIRCVRDGN